MYRYVFLCLLILLSGLFGFVHAQDDDDPVLPVVYVSQHPIDENENMVVNFDIHVINVRTGEIIFENTSPYWDCPETLSPSGEWLVYSQWWLEEDDYFFNRFLVNLHTGVEEQINDSIGIYMVKWLPDESGFLHINTYVENGENISRVYQYNLKEDTYLAIDLLPPIPQLLVSDQRLGYAFTNPEHTELTFRDLYGNHMIFPYSPAYGAVFAQRVSPDATYLPVNIPLNVDYDEYGMQIGNTDFILISIDGNEDIRIDDAYRTERHNLPQSLSWSPDSQSVFYINNERFFVIHNIENQQQQRFEMPEYDVRGEFYSSWSSDGHYIAFSFLDSENRIFGVLDVQTGQVNRDWTWDFESNVNLTLGYYGWVGDHEFVFVNTDSDVIVYNAETFTERNLTNTPEVIELMGCGVG